MRLRSIAGDGQMQLIHLTHFDLSTISFWCHTFRKVRHFSCTNAFYSVAIPALAASGYNAYVLWKEHWEHWEHLPPLEERTEYAYQNIRTKNFFWGDGDKTML